MDLFEKALSFPKSPGVYWMKDTDGVVLYIGKAKNLRSRVQSYFKKESASRYQTCPERSRRIAFLLRRTADIEYCITRNEQEALLLENKLIKEHKPRYNIELKDDKSYASLKLNIRHPFPGLFITRHIVKEGSLYFGPFVSVGALRQTVDFLTKHFKLRTCSDSELNNRSRPCLEYHIGHCSAPCVGKVSEEAYAEQIREAKLFLEGRTKELIEMVKEKMKRASGLQDYEEAARFRDLIFAVKETLKGEKAARFEEKKYDPLGDRLISNLQKRLRLVLKPAVIECVDISNFQGKEAVGSLVCFAGAKPLKNRYRKFKIRLSETPNDYVMMAEVLSRRFKRALSAETKEEKEKWNLPDLLLVDGGKGHLAIAQKILADLGIHNLAVAAIAKARKKTAEKKFSERSSREGEAPSPRSGVEGATRAPSSIDKIYIPGRKNPVALPSRSKVLLYLMRIRDEAHRFGISYHRKLRTKRLLKQ